MAPLDRIRLEEALALAESSFGISEPNPRVGCVLGFADGRVIGQGFTQRAGGPHAEIVALGAARTAGHDTRGATAWVTLEPCAHHGRTPPCCGALVEAGIARVVVAIGDPFPEVAGRGIEWLRAQGIAVDLAEGDLADEAREINVGFFSRFQRGRPWVRLKVAASLDGSTALLDGRSQWITGEQARIDGHRWRRRAGAILTGSGTVLADNPRLDVRLVPTLCQPMRVVVDSQLRMPRNAKVLAPPGQLLIVTAATLPQVAAGPAWANAEVIRLPGPAGRVDLAALIHELAARDVNELHVEAGATVNGALLSAGLVDELLFYMAPKLIGPGRSLATLAALDRLESALRWKFVDVVSVGDDLRIRARPAP